MMIMLLAAVLSGCSGTVQTSYSQQYEQALDARAGSPATGGDLSAFRSLFSNLKADDVREQVRTVYAPDLYFNDTLHTFTSHDALASYLATTGERADQIDVTYLDQWQSGSDIFVRWKMRTVFSVLGKNKDITSFGISHLRLNASGQVILHQDYWDSAEGLLRHLPVSGPAINWIGKRL